MGALWHVFCILIVFYIVNEGECAWKKLFKRSTNKKPRLSQKPCDDFWALFNGQKATYGWLSQLEVIALAHLWDKCWKHLMESELRIPDDWVDSMKGFQLEMPLDFRVSHVFQPDEGVRDRVPWVGQNFEVGYSKRQLIDLEKDVTDIKGRVQYVLYDGMRRGARPDMVRGHGPVSRIAVLTPEKRAIMIAKDITGDTELLITRLGQYCKQRDATPALDISVNTLDSMAQYELLREVIKDCEVHPKITVGMQLMLVDQFIPPDVRPLPHLFDSVQNVATVEQRVAIEHTLEAIANREPEEGYFVFSGIIGRERAWYYVFLQRSTFLTPGHDEPQGAGARHNDFELSEMSEDQSKKLISN